jgi:hypothetical protein
LYAFAGVELFFIKMHLGQPVSKVPGYAKTKKLNPQTRSNARLKRHGTQVWKPAIRQAGKPALQGFAMVLPVSL